MNDIEMLKKISSNLTERKSSAALSKYHVLCSNIKHLNLSLKQAINQLNSLNVQIKTTLSKNSLLNREYQTGKDLNPFIPVINRLQINSLLVLEKLSSLTEPDTRDGITIETVGLLYKGFTDYSSLITATRQYVDSIIADSYQLYLLDPKEFNYHVLVSLDSFDKYATKSLKSALFNPETREALSEFKKLSRHNWKNSAITACKNPTFAKKVDFLLGSLNSTINQSLANDLKNLFKFSSEFTHIGYVSTVFTSSTEAEMVFGDNDGPYLPSTENFSELKYEVLKTACETLSAIYIPSLVTCLKKIMIQEEHNQSIFTLLASIAQTLTSSVKSRNSEYYFFIKSRLIGSQESIPLTCMCGKTKIWTPPHDKLEAYCDSCGSLFHFVIIDGDGDYVFTSNGPIRIIGSTRPDFQYLSKSEQEEILKKLTAQIETT